MGFDSLLFVGSLWEGNCYSYSLKDVCFGRDCDEAESNFDIPGGISLSLLPERDPFAELAPIPGLIMLF